MPRKKTTTRAKAERTPNPLEGLHPLARAWHNKIRDDFADEDWPAHDRVGLEAAAWLYHRMLQAREIVNREGPVVLDRYEVPKEHPAAAMERAAGNQLRLMIRELALDVEPPASEPTRLPRGRRYGGR